MLFSIHYLALPSLFKLIRIVKEKVFYLSLYILKLEISESSSVFIFLHVIQGSF